MKLYYHSISTTSRPIMLFAAESGIALDMQAVDLFTGDMAAYPNVKRRLGRMKALKAWPQMYRVSTTSRRRSRTRPWWPSEGTPRHRSALPRRLQPAGSTCQSGASS